MAKNYSNTLKANLIQTSAEEAILYTLEINNTALAQPIRLVADKTDIVSNGDTYVACMFDIAMPNETQGEAPRVVLSIDNISRDITRFLEQLQGAPQTTGMIQQIKRSDPDFIEFDMTMDLINVSITKFKISGELKFDRTLEEPSINQIYNKRNAVGLF